MKQYFFKLSLNDTSMRLTIIFTLLSISSFCQDYAIGQWKSHFPLNKCIDIAQSTSTVYSASSSGIIILDKSTSEKSMLTKSEGLMDVDISTIYYNENNNQLIIGYKSGGIDIYQNGSITSILDVVRSPIIGGKSINNIKNINGYLYLCTEFGVVVFDDNKKEVKDTYYIGQNNALSINDIELYNDTFYVATELGVYSASSNTLLSNKNNWNLQNLKNSQAYYNELFVFKGLLCANLYSATNIPDTIYAYNKNKKWDQSAFLITAKNNSFEIKNNKIVISHDYGISIYDTTFTRLDFIFVITDNISPQPSKAIWDLDNDEIIWIADKRFGLIKNIKIWTNKIYKYKNPISNNCQKIEVSNNIIWIATGGIYGSQWGNVWLQEGVSKYDGIDWTIYNKENVINIDTVYDFIDIAIDPEDENHVYIATLGDGVLELKNGEVLNHFSNINSTLQEVQSGNDWYWIGATAVSFDNDGNLWVANHSSSSILSVLDTDGDWHGIDLRTYTSNSITGDLLLTTNNQAWLTFPKTQGILIFDANNTFNDTSDDNGIVLTQNYGLPSNQVYAVTEDLDGEIWIGTDKGIAVVYSPQNIFTGGGLEAKKILIEQDGYTEYLLENNTVSAIAVDAADRKWIGTRSSGVFLLSDDGTEEITHFTEENSPLPSNEIKTIAINHKTGEVFFGTEKGVVSYRAEATQGVTQHNTVSVYPNPVRETYSGPIAIKGLVTDAKVKITDISGNLVFETIALGGQAIWYGKDLNGNRAASGIYLVFSTNNDGSESIVSKILFIN